MARFLKAPQQTFVDMGGGPNVEFYTGLVDKAQENLEKATLAKQGAAEYYNNLPIHSKEDYDAVIGEAQKGLEPLLEEDFPSPSRTVNKILELNRKLTPGVQLLKRKDEQLKLEQEGKLRLGINWRGNELKNAPIVDASGNFVDPNTIESKYYNIEDVRNIIKNSQASRLMETNQGPLVQSEHPDYLKSTITFGKSIEEKIAMYGKDSPQAREEAERLLPEMPEGFIEVSGGKEEAINSLINLGFETAFSKEFAPKTISDYKIKREPKESSFNKNGFSPLGDIISREYVMEGEAKEELSKLEEIGKGYINYINTGKHNSGVAEFQRLREEYPSIYNEVFNKAVEKFNNYPNMGFKEKQATIAAAFMERVTDKITRERNYLESRAEVPSSAIPAFHESLNNIPDTYIFESEDGKEQFTKSDLTGPNTDLLSSFTKNSLVQMPLSKNYVMVYHKDKKKNIKIPVSSLDIGVQKVFDYTTKANELVKSDAINVDPIPFSSPITGYNTGNGVVPLYSVIYKRDGRAYTAYAFIDSNGNIDIGKNTEKLIEDNWGEFTAMKVKAFKDAYSNKEDKSL